jgi:hypothetical protein
LEKKINEYFTQIDNNPVLKYEQRKGSITIPKDFQGKISNLQELIAIPIPRIYLIGELCDYLGFDKDWLDDKIKLLSKKIGAKQENKIEEDDDEIQDEIKDEKMENDIKLFRILTHAKNKIVYQKLRLAAAGQANPMIVSKLLGLKDAVQDVNVATFNADGKTSNEIAAAIKAIEDARLKK